MAQARRSFAGRLRERTLELEALAAGAAPLDYTLLEELAHRLHGTAGSYGFAGVSRAAAELEALVRASAPDADLRQAATRLSRAMTVAAEE